MCNCVGDVFNGVWKGGVIKGKGTKYCASSNSMSTGQWDNGRMCGPGEKRYGCGDVYTGGFLDDM